MHLSRSRRIAAGLTAVAILAGSAFAMLSSDDSGTPPAEAALAADANPAEAAMRAFIDPETGELSYERRPMQLSKEAELARALNRSTEGLVEVYHPEGHVTVNLQGRFQSATVARVNAEGQVETSCVHDHQAAEGFRCQHDQAPTVEVQ